MFTWRNNSNSNRGYDKGSKSNNNDLEFPGSIKIDLKPVLVMCDGCNLTPTRQRKNTRRVVSLDSSLDIRSKKDGASSSSSQTRSYSSSSVSLDKSQPMQRLDFEIIEVGNTPLSSLRSCSEFHRNISNTGAKNIAFDDQNKLNKSLFSRLLQWKKRRSSNNVIRTKKLGVDEQTFMVERLRPISSIDSSDQTPIKKPRGTLAFSDDIKPNYDYHLSVSSSSSSRKPSVGAGKTASIVATPSGAAPSSNPTGKNKAKKQKNGVMYETSLAFDYIFGFRSKDNKKMPMEIELKTLSIHGSSNEVFSHHQRPLTEDFTFGRLSHSLLLSAMDVERLDPIPVLNLEGLAVPIPIKYLELATYLPYLNSVLSSVASFTNKNVLHNETGDLFYESIRVQPFGSGAYLRGMLLAGFTSLFFNAYNLALWPDFRNEGFTFFSWHFGLERFLYSFLLIQLIFNILQFPLRARIHFLCWESSRSMDVDSAIATLRNMVNSDIWFCNRGLGRIQDFLSLFSLVSCEMYLWLTPASDPLRALFVSLAATNLLSFIVRVIIAACFSLSMHDPEVLSDARRRGLSRWDIEKLPAFVYTNTEEVNNCECPICLSGFEMGEMLISLPCDNKHSFHASCIRQWLQRQNSCPLCQKMV